MTLSHDLQLWYRPTRAFRALFALYLTLALGYNLAFPPFEPSDEIDHFRYVRYLIEQRRLPVFEASNLSEYHQPPLYYALGAALSWPFRASDLPDYAARKNPYRGFRYWEPGVDNKTLYAHGPWDRWPFHGAALSLRVARLASLLCGAITVLLTYQLALLLSDRGASSPPSTLHAPRSTLHAPPSPLHAPPSALHAPRPSPLALAASGMVAFNPMFLAVTGSLQNDAGAAAAGALVLWLGVRFHRGGFTARRALILGLAVGLGALMKITVAFLLVPAALLVMAGSGRRVASAASRVAWLGAGAALGGGWWYLRNLLVYGDPTAVGANLNAYGGQTAAQGVALWGQSLPYAWTTFWGRFGHGEVVLPGWIYLTLAGISLLAAIGLALRLFRAPDRVPLLFLAGAGLVEFAGLLVYLTLSPTGAYGRYTFPALPAYMILFVIGLGALARRVTGGPGRPGHGDAPATGRPCGDTIAGAAGATGAWGCPGYGSPLRRR
ncbi:MAG: glycosyltransferase family 39 protein, partial [Chloroflexi bacterium]|nr:glycosyltransferase family 39 protein [Chloroflexota bacterium]